MKLVFAQGNPGAQYALTRHNVGFMVLDAIAAAEAAVWKKETKHRAEVALVTIGGEKTLLVKPTTFYNDTGLSARSLVDFYKITPRDDVLVIHDELALPFGTLRVRNQGSDAGNNGIKSLNAHLGGQYWRLRIGVWNETRDLMDDATYVLSRFKVSELENLHTTLIPGTILSVVQDFVAGKLTPTTL